MRQPYPTILISIFILQFWLSGLFVLSVIFTQKQDIQNLTLFTFISYAIGSFIAGILSDIYGRKPIFVFSSVLLAVSGAVAWQYPFYGYVLANLAIGPLNNLTFVFINEVFKDKVEIYTIYVLIGWAFSQITLGVFFYVSGTEVFMVGLFGVTLVYTVLSVLYVKETDDFIKNKQQQSLKRQQQQKKSSLTSSSINTNTNHPPIHNLTKRLKLILPTSLKPLIGGSILMFTMQMFYYRTQFTLDTFGVSLQLNTIVVGCTQLFANILFTRFLKSLKRNLALKILILSLMFLLLFLIFLQVSWLQTVIEGVMRLVDTGIMIVLGVYLPELFLTNEKGRGTNFVMCFGVFGSALNAKFLNHLPFWSLEGFLVVALAMTLLLKETKQNGDQLEECKNKEKIMSSQSIQRPLYEQEQIIQNDR